MQQQWEQQQQQPVRGTSSPLQSGKRQQQAVGSLCVPPALYIVQVGAW